MDRKEESKFSLEFNLGGTSLQQRSSVVVDSLNLQRNKCMGASLVRGAKMG